MKTNLIKYTVLFLLGSLLFGACESLEQEPINKYTDKKYWTTEARAQAVLNMAYNQMYSGAGMLWQDEAISDNMVDSRSLPDSEKIRTGVASSSTGVFESNWKWAYQGIKTCNVFMGNIDLVTDISAANKSRMIAEIRFIRALLYFRLVNFYGDIPFFLQDITVAESKAMTRTPKAQVISTLHQELSDLIDGKLLPKREQLSAAENGKITIAAAVMLKARLYLMDMDMVNVEKYCSMLINQQDVYGKYSLFTTASTDYSAYENLFQSAYEYNSEVILDYASISMVKEWDNYRDMAPNTVPGFRLAARVPTQSLVDSYITMNGLPVQGAVTYPTPYTSDGTYDESNPYVNRDPRLSATVVYHGAIWKDKDVTTGAATKQTINIKPGSDGDNVYKVGDGKATVSGYFARKLFDPNHRENLALNNNIIMMRYADVLLMYAEAKEYQSTFSQSVWDMTIKPLRQRAGFTASAAVEYPADAASSMREIIRRERRSELALEGLRYFDIIRWGQGKDLLDGICYGARMVDNNTAYIKVSTRKFTVGRDELWSVPQHDLLASPGLKPNNSGY